MLHFTEDHILLVSVVSTSNTSVTLSLALPEDLNDTTYMISYSNTNNTNCFNDTNQFEVTANTTGEMIYNLTGLQENTKYSILVTVALSKKVSFSKRISITTASAGKQEVL